MTKSSYGRMMRKKSEKLRQKAKLEMLRDYPHLMTDPEQKKKIFDMIDNAEVAVDSQGKIQIMYDKNNELKNIS
jgi:signal transduction protein with GAF and PtsI domain